MLRSHRSPSQPPLKLQVPAQGTNEMKDFKARFSPLFFGYYFFHLSTLLVTRHLLRPSPLPWGGFLVAVQKLETAQRSKVPEEGTEHAQPRAIRAAQRLVLMKASSEYDSTECDDEFVKKHGGKAHGV